MGQRKQVWVSLGLKKREKKGLYFSQKEQLRRGKSRGGCLASRSCLSLRGGHKLATAKGRLY